MVTHKQYSRYLVLLIPLLFAAAMLLFYPFRFRFEFDFDEGVNLIKAMLSLQGHQLYSDFWSDQPPVFTGLLAGWFTLLGLKVNAGRLLVLGFSTLLLISSMEYLRRKWGYLQAIIGLGFIVTLPFYTRLSVSIMIGLPSIALAMVAFVGLIQWEETHRKRWLSFSAILLALSTMTKIWTVILVPIFAAGIFFRTVVRHKDKVGWRTSIQPVIVWSFGFAAVVGLILLLIVRPGNLDQLIGSHLDASQTETMQTLAAQDRVAFYLDDSIPLFMLVPFGVAYALRSKAWHALYLLAWSVAAYTLLSLNAPFWYHHQLLITIPSAMMASIAVGSALVDLTARWKARSVWNPATLPSLVVLVIAALLVTQRVPMTLNNFKIDLPNFGTYDPLDEFDYEIVALIQRYADRTRYIYTDRPMYAFRSGMRVPPEIAVITQKRYSTNQPTQEEILSILESYKPEQVILSRFDIPAVREYMAYRNFVRVDNSPRSRHYVRGDIIHAE